MECCVSGLIVNGLKRIRPFRKKGLLCSPLALEVGDWLTFGATIKTSVPTQPIPPCVHFGRSVSSPARIGPLPRGSALSPAPSRALCCCSKALARIPAARPKSALAVPPEMLGALELALLWSPSTACGGATELTGLNGEEGGALAREG